MHVPWKLCFFTIIDKFSCDNGSVSLTSNHVCDRTTDCADGTDETIFECFYPNSEWRERERSCYYDHFSHFTSKYMDAVFPIPHIGCDRVIFSRSICSHDPLCVDESHQNCIHESKFIAAAVSVTVNTLHAARIK